MRAKRGGAQIFALFFLLPLEISLFVLSLGSRGISVVFEVVGPSKKCTFGVFWVIVCEPQSPGRVGPQGFHSHYDPESPNVHFGGPEPKFNEKTPRESTKSEISGVGWKKKSEILGGPAEGLPAEGALAESGVRGGRGSGEGGPAKKRVRAGGVRVEEMKKIIFFKKKKAEIKKISTELFKNVFVFFFFVTFVMFLDFCQHVSFCIPEKVVCIRKIFVSRKSTTFAERCIHPKTFCTPKKSGTHEMVGQSWKRLFARSTATLNGAHTARTTGSQHGSGIFTRSRRHLVLCSQGLSKSQTSSSHQRRKERRETALAS